MARPEILSAQSIRRRILELSFHGKSAHVGSSLSCVEILKVAFELGRAQDGFPDAKVILSKGHAAMALYAVAMEFGVLDDSVVSSYLAEGTDLWGHPSMGEKYPFIHWSTGSLGHGLPVAVGSAYASLKIGDSKRVKTYYCILSDGELDEGSNWEAIMFAGHHCLTNVCVVVDYNKIQSFGRCVDVINLEPLMDKFKAFNWQAVEVDGHDEAELKRALVLPSDGPRIVLAHTIKGRGVAEYEGTVESHYKPIGVELYKKYVLGEK